MMPPVAMTSQRTDEIHLDENHQTVFAWLVAANAGHVDAPLLMLTKEMTWTR
jgi:hypothetical protein